MPEIKYPPHNKIRTETQKANLLAQQSNLIKQRDLEISRLGKQRDLIESVNPYTIFENESVEEKGSVTNSMCKSSSYALHNKINNMRSDSNGPNGNRSDGRDTDSDDCHYEANKLLISKNKSMKEERTHSLRF